MAFWRRSKDPHHTHGGTDAPECTTCTEIRRALSDRGEPGEPDDLEKVWAKEEQRIAALQKFDPEDDLLVTSLRKIGADEKTIQAAIDTVTPETFVPTERP